MGCGTEHAAHVAGEGSNIGPLAHGEGDRPNRNAIAAGNRDGICSEHLDGSRLELDVLSGAGTFV